MSTNAEKFYEVFEVFARREPTAPMRHYFSLLAPNHDMAVVMAKENFFRREKIFDIWVVKRRDIRMLTEEERHMLPRLDKRYREAGGYSGHAKRWRALAAETAGEGGQKNGS
ncbi:phenylacetate-CoA oxygenase [Numidum massiliense]|uniref:phenylacetate-CoA oxygenase n=1 Tax=Numidum massiliense TaxID=1522315 RepID=UPI0006D5B753|nr:phenylacetate-CoA oxygenase [Numidum massiliense]